MYMSKEQSNNFINILILIFLALILAYPVSLFIKNRSDLSAAITEEQKQGFVSDQEITPANLREPAVIETGAGVQGGYKTGGRSTKYGSAIIRVTMNNVASLTNEQFYQVGFTPYSLLNTVGVNIKTPQVLQVVFNDPTIIQGFFDRETTQNIATDPHVLVEMIANHDKGITDFVNHKATTEALNSPQTLNVLAGSAFMANVLASPTAQFFLKNPLAAKELIAINEDLQVLASNENLRYLLLNFGPTKEAAKVALN